MDYTPLLTSAVVMFLFVAPAVPSFFVGQDPSITNVITNQLFYDFVIIEMIEGTASFEIFEYRSNHACEHIHMEILFPEDKFLIWDPLINKNQLNVTKCDMMLWENLNEYQKQGLRRHYEAGCCCSIPSENERAFVDEPVQACGWDRSYLSPMEYSHLYNTSACIPVSPFVCQWKNT